MCIRDRYKYKEIFYLLLLPNLIGIITVIEPNVVASKSLVSNLPPFDLSCASFSIPAKIPTDIDIAIALFSSRSLYLVFTFFRATLFPAP